jgi:hypothetical protein
VISFRTYRDAFPARWALYWLIVPNLAIILMWFVGGPPMTRSFTIFGIVALVMAQLSAAWMKRVALVVLIVQLNFFYVCALFNLHTSNFRMLPGFVREVRPFESPEYVLAAAVFAATVAISLAKAPRVPRFRSPMSYLLGIAVVFALLVADYAATASTRGSYRAAPVEGAPFASATAEAALTEPGEARRHLVLIVVEALGVPTDRTAKALFDDAWDRAHWRAQYDVRRGMVPFYGSTTNGELRELCGQWGHYTGFDFASANCLPARYRRAGYETTAIHGFAEAFFERDDWYRRAGFDHLTMGEKLIRSGVPVCPGVFPGACDRGIPPLIWQRLKDAEKPQFIYWLTLNTHLPVPQDAALQTEHCDLGGERWAAENPQVCRLFLLHRQIADAIDLMAMDPDLPPTDWVIVGDHLPPFFDRKSRGMFDQAHVPWIALRGADAEQPARTTVALR